MTTSIFSLLNTKVEIPAWALFLALLVTTAVAAFIFDRSFAEALAHKAVQSGMFQ